jgi:hypothetical protein
MGASHSRDGATEADDLRRILTDMANQVRRLALDVQALREEVRVGYDESGDSPQL